MLIFIIKILKTRKKVIFTGTLITIAVIPICIAIGAMIYFNVTKDSDDSIWDGIIVGFISCVAAALVGLIFNAGLYIFFEASCDKVIDTTSSTALESVFEGSYIMVAPNRDKDVYLVYNDIELGQQQIVFDNRVFIVYYGPNDKDPRPQLFTKTYKYDSEFAQKYGLTPPNIYIFYLPRNSFVPVDKPPIDTYDRVVNTDPFE